MPPLSRFQKSCIALAVGQAMLPANINAAVIQVDAPDTVEGCTLIDAVASANANDGNAVGFCAAGSAVASENDTLTLAQGELFELGNANYLNGLEINSRVVIEGGGSTIARADSLGDQGKRLIRVSSGSYLGLSGVALKDGLLNGGEGGGRGAAIYVDNARLNLQRVTLVDNQLEDLPDTPGTQLSRGGAIYAKESTVSISESVFDSNSAAYGAAVSLVGGEGQAFSALRSAFARNSATVAGGAIDLTGFTTAVINQSSFSFNSADNSGGAIALDVAAASNGRDTVVSLADNRFILNAAQDTGGAIVAAGESSLELSDSIFYVNFAATKVARSTSLSRQI